MCFVYDKVRTVRWFFAHSQEFFSKEALIAAGGGTQDGANGDFPSSDSEDDDYDPEGMEMRANSESEGESSEGGEDREDGEDSDSGSDSRGNETFSSDKDEQDPSDATNLKRLAKEGKRSSSSKEGTGGSQVSVSDDSDVSLVDEDNDGEENLGLRGGGSQAELSVSDEEAMVVGGKRHRKAVDYKRLHDVSFNEVHANVCFAY